jgi:hypothetical protein
LIFSIEGGASPEIIEYAQNFKWKHGQKIVRVHNQHRGLEKHVTSIWNAESDLEFAVFLEDDIEVSPYFFKWILINLRKYVFNGQVWINKEDTNLVGFSLYSPKRQEILKTFTNFNPYDMMPGHRLFLFQIPCSWGAVYFPWIWREYLDYYHWLKSSSSETQKFAGSLIPRTRLKLWIKSWKR